MYKVLHTGDEASRSAPFPKTGRHNACYTQCDFFGQGTKPEEVKNCPDSIDFGERGQIDLMLKGVHQRCQTLLAGVIWTQTLMNLGHLMVFGIWDARRISNLIWRVTVIKPLLLCTDAGCKSSTVYPISKYMVLGLVRLDDIGTDQAAPLPMKTATCWAKSGAARVKSYSCWSMRSDVFCLCLPSLRSLVVLERVVSLSWSLFCSWSPRIARHCHLPEVQTSEVGDLLFLVFEPAASNHQGSTWATCWSSSESGPWLKLGLTWFNNSLYIYMLRFQGWKSSRLEDGHLQPLAWVQRFWQKWGIGKMEIGKESRHA